jgi:predicted amidohydrolase
LQIISGKNRKADSPCGFFLFYGVYTLFALNKAIKKTPKFPPIKSPVINPQTNIRFLLFFKYLPCMVYLYTQFLKSVYILKQGVGRMKIGFISRGAVEAQTKECQLQGAELILCGFRSLGEVSYERELRGETRYFADVADFSQRTDAVVICGCVTDTKGFKRKSAVVAENGKLLGVSDMLNVVDGEMNSGAALRVYDTKAGKIGVMVGEDLYFPEITKSLTLCGSDVIVCPYGVVENGIESVLIRAQAFCYGVPICLCGIGYAAIGGVDGSLEFASPNSPAVAEFEGVKEYHLVESRRRGFYRPPRKMY